MPDNDKAASASSGNGGAGGFAANLFSSYAETGKSRATTAIDDLSRTVADVAGILDRAYGAEAARPLRAAADTIADLALTIRKRDFKNLYQDGLQLARNNPAAAAGAALVLGFGIIRLIETTMPDRKEQAG